MHSMRVVVADGDPFVRLYFELVLPELGHDVVGTAETPGEVGDLCRALHPDLVVGNLVPCPAWNPQTAGRPEELDMGPVACVSRGGRLCREHPHVEGGCIVVDLAEPIGEPAVQAAIDEVIGLYYRFRTYCACAEEGRGSGSPRLDGPGRSGMDRWFSCRSGRLPMN